MASLLDNPEVIKWCYQGITDVTLATTSRQTDLNRAKKIEDEWGDKVTAGNGGGQWTTKLCQDLVMEALTRLGRKNVRKAKIYKSKLSKKGYQPDLECDQYVYEVKGRNWTTTGTAGEKILGVPLKYGEVPSLYNKPLQIVLVGYQEYEAKKKFAFGDLLDKNFQTKELQESLAFYKEHNIEYVAFTDILKKLGLVG